MKWNEFPTVNQRSIPIPPEIIVFLGTLTPQRRGNWAEYLYAEEDIHGKNEPFVESYSVDGTYTEDGTVAAPYYTKGGIKKGHLYELKTTNVINADGIETDNDKASVRFYAANINLTWIDDGWLVMGLITPTHIKYRRVKTRSKFDMPPLYDENDLWLGDM